MDACSLPSRISTTQEGLSRFRPFHAPIADCNEKARAYPGLLEVTFVAGSLSGLDRCAGSPSASAALPYSIVTCPWHGRLCHDAQQQSGEPWLRFRGVPLLCCVRL